MVPIYPSNNCDYDINITSLGGWYWATRNGSADYFHRNGTGEAKSPDVTVFFGGFPEKRYPYGYPSSYIPDSAFAGIRIIQNRPAKADHHYVKGTFNSYKEYIQSRLNHPLLGNAVYSVKFYVSKTQKKHLPIKQICALFSETAIVNPFTSDGTGWSNNLAFNDSKPIQYITEAQICSHTYLDKLLIRLD